MCLRLFVAASYTGLLCTASNQCTEDRYLLKGAIVAPPNPLRDIKPYRSRSSVFRWLSPAAHFRSSKRFQALRYSIIPQLRYRVQSRLYKVLVSRQHKKVARRASGRGILPFLSRRKSRILEYLAAGNANAFNKPKSGEMMNYDASGRVPGARRERLKGYLKAANELRQSYQETLQQRMQAEDQDGSGAFQDAEIVRRGDEEMILFPSYARRHKKRSETDVHRNQPGSYGDDVPHSSGDADYWKLEWEKYEDANAIVDVDVRGWIYSPQKGPMSRRNRLVVAVARRLSGIPAPSASSPAASRSSSPRPAHDTNRRDEEAAAALEAEQIAQRGYKEADAAWRGTYSIQQPGRNIRGTPASSRSSSPISHTRNRSANIQDHPGESEPNKRASWSNQSFMTYEESLKANDLLMSRLKPFLTLPLANTTITVFFFNDQKSSSKSVTTNESGHFNVRAALNFIPTQVRVLASEDLSATEEVRITESKGVSFISDVDDTIKHSAIASGVKEIFKNTFVRELESLTIKGVKEWYNRVSSMGVQMHYVSNSPWQLYPLLKSYFKLAGLPPGSFHLKEYSGMLQGIFEPAAERKRGSLDRIMNDFPDRKFILVGDSGEADLEVYTDVVLAHPGRVLGVFIRDVTTPIAQGFFDQSNVPLPQSISGNFVETRNSSTDASDATEARPTLPMRPKPQAEPQQDLIDFSDEPDAISEKPAPSPTYSDDLRSIEKLRTSGGPPGRPAKPSSLRHFSSQPPASPKPGETESTTNDNNTASKAPPPPKPRRSSKTVASVQEAPAKDQRPPTERYYSSSSMREAESTKRPPMMGRTPTSSSTRSAYSSYSAHTDEGYVAAAQRKLNTAYNALPAIRSQSRERGDGAPPVPPRRGITSMPAAAARWATGASGGDPSAGGDGGALGASYDKKEEMWRRRWARAEDIMQRNRTVLRTWRVGTDVMEECISLIEQEMRRQR